jgi:hypothetical protein
MFSIFMKAEEKVSDKSCRGYGSEKHPLPNTLLHKSYSFGDKLIFFLCVISKLENPCSYFDKILYWWFLHIYLGGHVFPSFRL